MPTDPTSEEAKLMKPVLARLLDCYCPTDACWIGHPRPQGLRMLGCPEFRLVLRIYGEEMRAAGLREIGDGAACERVTFKKCFVCRALAAAEQRIAQLKLGNTDLKGELEG